MDFATISPTDRTLKLNGPDGEPTGISVVVCSINDERMKKVRRQIQDKRLYLEARGKTFKSEELNDNQSLICFTAVTSWDWGTDPKTGEKNTFGGKIPEWDRKTAFDVFEKVPTFRDQITEGISEEKSFFKDSASI